MPGFFMFLKNLSYYKKYKKLSRKYYEIFSNNDVSHNFV